MDTTHQDLLSLFLRLAPIPGLSHDERVIADEVKSILTGGGVKVIEDNAALKVKGTTGNLLCFPPGFDERSPTIMLTAHLDTVQSTLGLRVLRGEDRVCSDGTTILGADNRMGVSVLVDLLLRRATSGSASRNFFVVFSVCEETGLEGAGALDVSKFDVSAAYVFDCSRRPGIYIREAVGISKFSAEFVGRAAHAGVNPEEGVNAIGLSSLAISKLKLGRIDSETTMNIGKIRGGSAVNIVPEKVVVEGEVRSFSEQKIAQQLDHIEKTFHDSVHGSGRVTFHAESDCEPYVHTHDSAVVAYVERAMRSVGLEPDGIRYGGGSDANRYNAAGIPAVNIGIGAQKPHSTEEFFLLADLAKVSEIAEELVRA